MPRVLNWFELEWQDFAMGPPLYHARYVWLSRLLGARKLGYHARIQPPRTLLCPYHAHLVNEELFVVLGGEPSIRLDGREHRLREGDVVALPPGPESAHQLVNRSDRPVHLLAASTMIPHDVIDYPESRKRLFFAAGLTGDATTEPPPGVGETGEIAGLRFTRVMLRDGRVTGYLDGEPGFDVFGHEPEVTERDPRIIRMAEVEWEPVTTGGAFAGERKRLGRRAGARLLGYSLYRLQPGQRAFPFHLHHVNEEFFYIRSGFGRLRTADGLRPLRPGDAFSCPPGPDGAHEIVATGDRPLEYFALSTMLEPEISEHPDSGKIYVMVGSPPGGDPEVRAVDLVFRSRDAVEYLEGEGLGAPAVDPAVGGDGGQASH